MSTTTAEDILSVAPLYPEEFEPKDLYPLLPERDEVLIRNTLRRMVEQGRLAETEKSGGYQRLAPKGADESAGGLPAGGPERHPLGFLEGIPEDVFFVWDLPGAGQMRLRMNISTERVGAPVIASGHLGPAFSAAAEPTAQTEA